MSVVRTNKKDVDPAFEAPTAHCAAGTDHLGGRGGNRSRLAIIGDTNIAGNTDPRLLRTACKRTARRLSQDPTHLLEFILKRNMRKSFITRPEDRDFALEESCHGGARMGDSEDDVPTVPALTTRPKPDGLGKEDMSTGRESTAVGHLLRMQPPSAIKPRKDSRCEKRQAVRQEHRDAISALDQEQSKIEASLLELNDKIPLSQEKASKRFSALKALQELENKKVMKKVGDKSWMHEQQRKREAMEVDDEPAKLEEVYGGEQARG
ncbi:hypothetical protein FDENT_7806 [Fusarium denticulatum]|uniref:Uncharacterized protein n=1 Tax=Fusarium denticulatum TaxID=48507 RepID=A0A8H5U7G6_9HYPO|nr:hypothetical protein FDENT_7806 [Fusarium denticulatum]